MELIVIILLITTICGWCSALSYYEERNHYRKMLGEADKDLKFYHQYTGKKPTQKN